MMSFYDMVEDHVRGICWKIYEKMYGEDAPYTVEWEFSFGDILVTVKIPVQGCGCHYHEPERREFSFPSKLIWENEDGIDKYLETIEKKDEEDD